MSRNFTADQTLTDRLIIDDTKAFEELYKRYWHSLYIYGLRKLHFPEDAKKIVSNVFVDLWGKRHFLSESFPLSEYLYEEGKKGVIKCLSKKIAHETKLVVVKSETVSEGNVHSLFQAKLTGIKEDADTYKYSEITRQQHRKLIRYVNGEAINETLPWLSDTKPNTYLTPEAKKQLEKEILAEIQLDTKYLLFFPKKVKPWWQKIAAMI